MEVDQIPANPLCRLCGCTHALAGAHANAIGLSEEFLAGQYTCCQIVQWADELWIAWREAEREDGEVPGEIRSGVAVEPDPQPVPVRVKKAKANGPLWPNA